MIPMSAIYMEEAGGYPLNSLMALTGTHTIINGIFSLISEF